MSRFGRAMEKAEREGLLTWTRSGEAGSGGRDSGGRDDVWPAVAPPSPRLQARAPLRTEDIWDTHAPDASEVPFSPLLVVAAAPSSPAAEQYRLLRTRLEGLDRTGRSQLLIVSSPGVGEGKTTTSTNLALSMAEESRKVVLVEADLRRPSLARLFGLPDEPGLIDVLVGAATLDDALVAVPGTSLWLLPAGVQGAHATGLLGSPLMQRCLDGLRGRFDRIVVDTPPLSVADTHILTRLADGILVVVRSGVTPRPMLERALEGLDRAKVAGMVLNGVETSVASYGDAAASRVTDA